MLQHFDTLDMFGCYIKHTMSVADQACTFCREGLVHRPRFAWRCVQQQPMPPSSTKDDFENEDYERDKGCLNDDYKTDDIGPAPDPWPAGRCRSKPEPAPLACSRDLLDLHQAFIQQKYRYTWLCYVTSDTERASYCEAYTDQSLLSR